MESKQKKYYDKSPTLLQNMVISGYSAWLHCERYGGEYSHYSDYLEKSQWFDSSQHQEYQNAKLAELISYSYEKVPYYNRIMKQNGLLPGDIKSREDLGQLPVLTKEDIRLHSDELLSTDYRYGTVKKGHTSGTTGTPLEICYSNNLVQYNYALLGRQYKWSGADLSVFGDRVAVIRGNVIVPLEQKKPPFWRKNYLYNQLLFSAFHLTVKNLPYYIDELRRFSPKIIDGYPSTLYILAKYLKNNNEKFKVHAVISASETLYDFQREIIEESFDCRIYDYFASAERVLFATECSSHEGHHIAEEFGITEVLDDNRRELAAGQEGTLIATSLHNYAMPMIRYVTNDRTSLKTHNCSCGRNLPLMEDVTTKAEDLITLKDGRIISPSVLTHPLKPLVNITESQIIQESPELIRILLVTGARFTDNDRNTLVRGLEERLGQDVELSIELVDKLERTRSGKFKWVISRVSQGI